MRGARGTACPSRGDYRGDRGGRGRGATGGEGEAMDLTSAPVVPEPAALNTKAVPSFAGLPYSRRPGNSTLNAGRTPRRLGSKRSSQMNKISNYVKITPQRVRARTRSKDKDAEEEENKRRKVVETPRKTRPRESKRRPKSPTSPTTPEMKRYTDLARKLHKGGSLGQARAEQLTKPDD